MAQYDFNKILEMAAERGATDVHLVANHPPILRIDGDLRSLEEAPLEPADLQKIVFDVLTERQKDIFCREYELDFSYFFISNFHCRVNIHKERGSVAANIRLVPKFIRTPEELGLPPVVRTMIQKRSGLIIVSGPAGSGKTTTMASLVNIINENSRSKIITIEDPIEYVHQSQKSLVVQREVGSDTRSFHSALKYALRQDPDVVVIGEMRDLESISMALTTAETGHLVLTTLHAPNTVETMHRIIDVYPAEQQRQIRIQLAECLIGVIGQSLLKPKQGTSRVLATEVLLAAMSVRNIIRRGAMVEIRGQLDAENSGGMRTFEHSLSELVKKGLIARETAVEHAKHPSMLTC